MKPTQSARMATGQNKIDSHTDVDVDERIASQGSGLTTAAQQPTRPAPATPEVVKAANEPAIRSEAERWRGSNPPSSQGAKSAPSVRGSAGGAGRGGSGGGAGMKMNRGLKGATPVDPHSSFSIYNYAKGGQVGKVGSFGLHRSKPDFAGGGPRTNFKDYSKKGDT